MRRKHYGSLCCTFFFGPATESCDIGVSSNLKQRRFAVRLIRIRYGINIQWFFSNTIATKRELMKVSARSSYCPLIAISNQMRETDPWYGNCSEVSDVFCTLVAAGPPRLTPCWRSGRRNWKWYQYRPCPPSSRFVRWGAFKTEDPLMRSFHNSQVPLSIPPWPELRLFSLLPRWTSYVATALSFNVPEID